MLRSPQVTFSFSKIFAVLLLPVILSSCSIHTFIKKPPANKPFVYKTTIRVEGDLPGADKKDLQTRLQNQLDDSIRVRTKSYPLWETVYKPPAFDTNSIRRTEVFMKALMNSLGYFAAQIRDTYYFKSQYQTYVDFVVNPGKGLRFDSVGFALETPEWQQLVSQNQNQTLLRKNERYSRQLVGQELDRVIELLRNNGYYKVTKEDVYAEADTVAFGLIDPTLDPFEQAALIEQLQRQRDNPTVNVVIKQRILPDSFHTRLYFINKVIIYPDVPLIPDSSVVASYDTTTLGKFVIISQTDKFKKNFLPQYSSIKPGQKFSQNNYFKTITKFNQLGAWEQASVDVYESPESDSLLDAVITLYPSKKYALILDLETSLNNPNSNNPTVVATSNLFGVGLNVGLRNKNFGRQSIQSTTNARVGVELGKNFVQTRQTSLAQNFYFPKFIHPFRVRNLDSLISPRTILSFNAAYTDRRDFFKLSSVNVAWGYEWGRNNHIWFYRPFNVEYTKLIKRDSLDTLIKRNPSLQYAFNDGLVISQQAVYRWQKLFGRNSHAIRVAVEESGGIFGNIRSLDIDHKLFRFVRGEAQYTYTRQFRRSALAFRVMGGVGLAYGDSSSTVKEKTLPFFKQFFAGGPNSMRAWQVRQLGYGSSKNPTGNTFDKFGDVQFETNLEYRFIITTIAGIKVGSALYVDAGNIWQRKTYGDPSLTNGEFKFGRFFEDLAIGTGTGVRFDFNYFLLRLDYAYKVKDPNRPNDPEKWFYNWKIFNGQLQLGVNYPF